ncbi:porin [Vibrio sp. Isolate25]|uniref:porin n=1 Tax=unclassified Vibrio TaxID=2614977 RepID=UPI001EFD7536|nr:MULTISPECIES: porin [unclassified Vibrio]MCG9595425.1 porin [Vibrio sp. Isolate25]MCG9676917.1 porin [Vibrio sp. Isolate24]
MKIKLLAAVIAATACGTNAFAAEIYNSEGSTISIGGYVDVGIGEYDSADEVEVHDVSPRINISGTQDLGNGVTVDAKGEWALDYLDGGDTSFTTRLGYIGATHDQFGRFVVGTQWSPYYDVAGVADLPIAFANEYLYDDHNNLGTARGEDMVSYRKAIELGDMGSLNLGLAWQGEHTDSTSSTLYDARGQIALSIGVYGFNLGYSYNGGDVANVDAHSHVFAFSSGSYGDGLYSAVVYAMNENMNDDVVSSGTMAESDQYEVLLAYAFGNGWNLSANYEAEINDKTNKTQYSESALQAEYTFTPKFMGFVGYQFDLGNDINVKEEDNWTIGARYFL